VATAIVAFLVVFLVAVYGIGLAIGGLLLAVLSAFLSAIMGYYVREYLKPKPRLKVSGYDLVPREFGNLRGFQIGLRFKNEGKKIATKPEIDALVKRDEFPAQYLRVEIHSDDGKKSVKPEILVNTAGFPWRWDPRKVHSAIHPSIEMRTGDEAQVTFPEESRPQMFVAGVDSGSHGVQYENVVEFKPGKYTVSVELKCEDPQERTTEIVNWKTDIDLTKRDTYAKYWLNPPG
jgi:hypothetical protein